MKLRRGSIIREGNILENQFHNNVTEDLTIPVVEEQLSIGKEVVEKGAVRITDSNNT